MENITKGLSKEDFIRLYLQADKKTRDKVERLLVFSRGEIDDTKRKCDNRK